MDKTFEILSKDFKDGILRFKHPYHMYDAIQDIPGCLEKCLAPENLDKTEVFMKENQFKNIFFIGCGTSLNSGKLAAYFAREILRMPAVAMNALDFMVEDVIGLTSDSLAICLSHSGNTVPTCRARDKALEYGAKVISVIGVTGTELADKVDLILEDPYGAENVYGKTRSFLSAALLATLPVLMMLPKERKKEELAKALQMVDAVKDHMADWEKKAIEISREWGVKTDRYMFIGMGALSVLADELALKIIEVMTLPAIGFGLEESLHGPASAYWPNTGIILLQTDDRVLWRALNIDGAVNATLASDIVITTAPDAGWNENAFVIGAPKMDAIWAAYPCAVAAQMAVYFISVQKGFITDINGKDRNPYTINCRPHLKFTH